MTQKELIAKVAESNRISQDKAKEIVISTFKIVKAVTKAGGKVMIADFGSFERRTRPAKVGFNPAKKVKIDIPEKDFVKFKASINILK